MKFSACVLSVVLLTVMFNPASAALIAYEGFDFDAGIQLQNQSGSGSGIGTLPAHPLTDFRWEATANGLSYLNLLTSGRAASLDTVTSGTMDLNMPLNTPVSSGDLYFSYLVEVEAVSNWGLMWGLLNAAGENLANNEAAVRTTSTPLSKFGNFGDGFDDRTGPDAVAGNLYFIVGHITGIGAGVSNGTMTTWFNPTDLSDVAGSAGTTIASTGGTFDSSISHVWMGLGGEEDAIFDEIRLGTTLDDVVPHVDLVLTGVVVEDTIGTAVETSLGIEYVLESSDAVVTNWTSTGMSVLGNGGTMYLFDPTGFSTSKIYRVTGQVP